MGCLFQQSCLTVSCTIPLIVAPQASQFCSSGSSTIKTSSVTQCCAADCMQLCDMVGAFHKQNMLPCRDTGFKLVASQAGTKPSKNAAGAAITQGNQGQSRGTAQQHHAVFKLGVSNESGPTKHCGEGQSIRKAGQWQPLAFCFVELVVKTKASCCVLMSRSSQRYLIGVLQSNKIMVCLLDVWS